MRALKVAFTIGPRESANTCLLTCPTPAKFFKGEVLLNEKVGCPARPTQPDLRTMATEKVTKKQLRATQFRKKDKKGEGVTKHDAVVEGEEPVTAEQSGPSGKVAETEKKKGAKKGKGKEEGGEEKTLAAATVPEKEVRKEKKRKRREEKESGEEQSATTPDKTKKRKHDEVKAETPKSKKKRFTEDGEVEEVEMDAVKDEVKDKVAEESKDDDKRYIVFVGNMSFQSTSEQIAKHFSSHCSETPTVRLLTRKGDASKLAQLPKSKQKSIARGKAADPSAPTSKGCAFVEFKLAASLQKALQFHHTQFEGRNINVELTAGGGGKGDGRKEKIRKKNQDLEAERQKLHEKYVKTGKKEKSKEVGAAGQEEAVKSQPAAPHWGPRASASATKGRGTTKIPKWAASGANAMRLSG